MSDPTPTLAAEIKALEETYAALNRNDVDGFLEIFDAGLQRVEPPGLPGAPTFKGIEAFRAHVEVARGTWAEGACQPTRYAVFGNKVVVFAHVRVRLKGQSEWLEGPVVDVFTFRDGKAVDYRSFLDEAEALKWAGANDAEL